MRAHRACLAAFPAGVVRCACTAAWTAETYTSRDGSLRLECRAAEAGKRASQLTGSFVFHACLLAVCTSLVCLHVVAAWSFPVTAWFLCAMVMLLFVLLSVVRKGLPTAPWSVWHSCARYLLQSFVEQLACTGLVIGIGALVQWAYGGPFDFVWDIRVFTSLFWHPFSLPYLWHSVLDGWSVRYWPHPRTDGYLSWQTQDTSSTLMVCNATTSCVLFVIFYNTPLRDWVIVDDNETLLALFWRLHSIVQLQVMLKHVAMQWSWLPALRELTAELQKA
jgi:hypothetical protein